MTITNMRVRIMPSVSENDSSVVSSFLQTNCTIVVSHILEGCQAKHAFLSMEHTSRKSFRPQTVPKDHHSSYNLIKNQQQTRTVLLRFLNFR